MDESKGLYLNNQIDSLKEIISIMEKELTKKYNDKGMNIN